jgi:uncharacterized protein YjbJ (UPF0337 family)
MDKDTLKGKVKDIAGRAKRQVGEWTDDSELQSEGAAEQVEGKVQKGVGKAKEAGRDAMDKAKLEIEKQRAKHRDKNREAA